MQSKISDNDFIEMFSKYGGQETANKTGINIRTIMKRRSYLEKSRGIIITPPSKQASTFRPDVHPQRIDLNVEDGSVLIGSDAHIWPGEPSTAIRAIGKFAKLEGKNLKGLILNGDVLDGATISRYPPSNWASRPRLIDEIQACQEQLAELERSALRVPKFWPLGNHDGRFESRLASVAPEYAAVHGMHLKDHFPLWEPCWSVWINNDVVVKHRWKGGIHATHNNALWSGKTIITGHLHSLQVRPLTLYGDTSQAWPKTIWGVDTGTLADPYGPQFDYVEDSPRNWRSGFVKLNFKSGRLLWPEVINVIGPGRVEYRDQIIEV